jgi:MFS family permease
VFAAPYANGFNDHLRVDRGFSGPEIGLFQWVTNMPYSIGVVLGGSWLERWGRRRVGGLAAFGSAVANSVQFLFGGVLFWIVSAFGSLLAGPLLPALGVVGAESFPTAQRGRQNGLLTATSLAGSALGLVLGGALADRYGFPKAMVCLAVAPILLSVIVRFWYPDGTGQELEDFNPGEATPQRPATEPSV